jgi:RarD protein|tara:strand:+ start:387 stop:1289 length:903 start_codon:yes stop_codon:yes gene_type:complete
MDIKDEKIAIPIVLIAGLFWSFGPLVIRYVDQPELFPWQYLFARGLIIFIILNFYLYLNEGTRFVKNYLRIGLSGMVGSVGLASAMMSFIWSITHTSVAITLLCLAAMPLITALLGFIFLKEKISINTWISIVIAAIGIYIMAMNDQKIDNTTGLVFGLTSAFGFSIFSISLRWRKETPQFTTVSLAGLICALFSFYIIIQSNSSLFSSSKNEMLFSLHGTLVCIGLILYSIGSKHLPAAELTLLSLTEVIGGIFWVWLPLFGINEVPSTNTIIGGFLIFISLIYYSLLTKNNRRFIGLN